MRHHIVRPVTLALCALLLGVTTLSAQRVTDIAPVIDITREPTRGALKSDVADAMTRGCVQGAATGLLISVVMIVTASKKERPLLAAFAVPFIGLTAAIGAVTGLVTPAR
jgi:hypothetical protein